MADGLEHGTGTEALEALHPAAWRWALHLARGEREFAQDVLQDAYLTLLEGRAKWRGQSAYKTFVFGVIRMTARAQSRKRALRRLRFPLLETEDAPAPGPSDPLLQSTLRAMHSLPKRQAEVAELVFSQDLTLEEAAQVMGIGVGSARTHYARAKTRLRALLNVEAGDD